jgi:LacI family transcriptional regulator
MPADAARRGTLEQVAHAAGVGIATVDRVLNERGNVSSATTDRVLAAARALNLRRVLPGVHRRTLRVEVLLARPELPLVPRIAVEYGKLAQRVDRSVLIQRTTLKTDEPQLIAERIRTSIADGIAVHVESDPEVNAAVDAVTAAGRAVVTFWSDLPGTARLAYAGVDQTAAGRTAGYFVGRTVRDSGRVIVLCKNLALKAHVERISGFAEALTRHSRGLAIDEIVEGNDDIDQSERLLRRSLKRDPHVAAIYNVGAANRAVAAVIRAWLPAVRPVFVGHELTRFSRPLLLDGTMALIIDQNPEQQARFVLDVLMHHFGHTEFPGIAPPYRSDVPFTLYTPENPGLPLPDPN